MIVSERNKLPALSLEVKNSNDSTIKQCSVALRASRNAFRKKNKQDLVFMREEETVLIIG